MSTFVRRVDLLGPTLAALLRVTRRVTLLVASLAVAVTACGPVGVVGPPGPGPDETDVTEVTEVEAPPEDPPIRAPDCERTGPMVPC
jgi:hypothetical protein